MIDATYDYLINVKLKILVDYGFEYFDRGMLDFFKRVNKDALYNEVAKYLEGN